MNDKEFTLIITKTLLIGVAIISAEALIIALFFPEILFSTGVKVKTNPEFYRWAFAALSAIALPMILISAHHIKIEGDDMKKLKEMDGTDITYLIIKLALIGMFVMTVIVQIYFVLKVL